MKAQFTLRRGGHRLFARFTLLLLAFLTLLPNAIKAQTGPEVQDVRPYAPLTGTSIESISLMNGSLNVNIPLWSFPQRGKLKLDFRLGYDTTTYVETQICVYGGPGGGFPGEGSNVRPLSKRAHISREAKNYALQEYANSISQGPSPDSQAPPTSCSNPVECLAGDICILYWIPGGYDPNFTLYKPEEHEGIRVYASTDIAVFPEAGYFVGDATTYPYYSGIYWKVRTPDGGSHNLIQTTSGDFRAADGTGWEYQPNTCTLRDNEGTAYSFSCTPPTYPGDFTNRGLEAEYMPGFLNYVEDTNGNRITVNRTAGGEIVSWTDTVGRTIPALPALPTTFDGPSAGVTLPPPASGCPAETVTSYSWQIPGVSNPIIFCETYVPVQTHLFPPSYYVYHPTYATYEDFAGTIPMIAGLIQPSGDTWKFQYTPIQGDTLYGTPYNNGDLSQITLPTGGTIQYTWDTPNNFCGVKPEGTTAHGKVMTRTLSAGNGAPPSTWRYGGDFPTLDGLVTTVVETDPNENKTYHTITPVGGCSYYEGTTAYYDNQQTLLKTETTTYQGIPAPEVLYEIVYAGGALPTAKSITWPDGTNATTTFSYDSGFTSTQNITSTPVSVPYGNQILKNEYGFSSGVGTTGTPLRSTATTYMAFGSYAESAAAYQQNMIALPSTVTETDALTNKEHATEYLYDETSLTNGNASSTCGTSSSTICWDSALTNGPVRGNQTSVSRSLDTAGGVLTTQVGYTNTGMISSITLPSNTPYPDTTTTYGYSGAYQGAFLTSVTNSLGQSKSYTYDPVTSLLQTAQDENGNTTTYNYYPDTRLQSIVYPAISFGISPETDYAYPSPNEVDKSQKQSASFLLGSSSSWIQQQTLYDGLGRSYETKLLNGCSGGDYIETDTGYDLLGRAYSVTNPHCGASSSSTDGTTYHLYDALGRPTTLTEPDGNTQSWAYNDDTTTFYDENQSAWARTNDALGRLQRVIEPGGLETDYGYDGFDNLTSVTQSGQPGTVPTGFVTAEAPKTRSFTYDSLNRLLTSTNPETGTICYGIPSGGSSPDWRPIGPPGGGGAPPPTQPQNFPCINGYDAHGNLLYKTDANGTTQSFSYDALNRLVSKSASDNSVADTYTYDQTGVGSNEVGRLSSTDNNGAAGNTFSYDAMGHIISGTYYTPGSNGWQPSMTLNYDLTGSPTLLQYPDGTQITQTWDAAGRLVSVKNNNSGVNYISGITYTPAGAESSFTLGNGVAQTDVYNNRLQPSHTMVSTPALPAAVSGGNLLDRASYYTSAASNCTPTPKNNGNIYSIVDSLNVGWTQSFNYDCLNRLTSALRSDGGYNHTYNYDSFGNMAVTDNLNSNPVWGVDPATNQLLRNPVAGVTDSYGHPLNFYTYDYAGNMVNSGSFPIGHAYQYNALNQITCVDCGNANMTPTAMYTYNGNDERVYKQTATDWSQYVYFNGQVMGEQNSAGTWSDYIYANGQKIAKVSPGGSVVHLSGSVVAGSGSVASGIDLSGMNGITIQAGDTLRMWQYTAAENGIGGGIWLSFTDGNYSSEGGYSLQDQNGQYSNWDQVVGQWHQRTFNLAHDIGETVNQFVLLDERTGAVGQFDFYFADIWLQRADGTVVPIWNGAPAATSLTTTVFGPGQSTAYSDNALPPGVDSSFLAAHYFVDDHLGTAQMELTGDGWPMWQGQFTPFGLELPDGSTDMDFKFTGKQRDKETGLDNFGARYYASGIGRWNSPDWADKPEAVPYSSLSNPQSLNLYQYVGNNPLSKADADGHMWGFIININSNSIWNRLGGICFFSTICQQEAPQEGKAQQQGDASSATSASNAVNAAKKAGGVLSTVKKWFGIGKTVVDDYGTVKYWTKYYNAIRANYIRDTNESYQGEKGSPNVDLALMNYAQQNIALAGMQAAADANGHFSSVIGSLDKGIIQMQQLNVDAAWKNYVSERNAYFAQQAQQAPQ